MYKNDTDKMKREDDLGSQDQAEYSEFLREWKYSAICIAIGLVVIIVIGLLFHGS